MATLYDDISLGYHACGGSKVGKLYSFKPTDGSGDFTCVRATTPNRINQNGDTEVVPVNTPVIDWSTGSPLLIVTVEGELTLTTPASATKIVITIDGEDVEYNNVFPTLSLPVGSITKVIATVGGTEYDLLRDYLLRVDTASGTINEQGARDLKSMYEFLDDEGLLSGLELLYLSNAGIVQRTDGVLKYVRTAFDASDNDNDLDGSATASQQPRLVGGIAPNSKPASTTLNGEARYFTHTPISFGAGDAWSVTTVFNLNENKLLSGLFGDAATHALRLSGGSSNGGYQFRLITAASINNYFGDSRPLIGKESCLTIVGDNGLLKVYLNGLLINTVTQTTDLVLDRLLYGRGQSSYSSISAHIIQSQALTATQVASLHTTLRGMYPEIESVVIGTQTWASRNFEAVATPLGNVIANVTENGAVEKVTNVADREFSSDTGFWGKNAGVTIGSNVCSYTSVGNATALFKTAFLTIGKYYKTTYTILNYNTGGISVQMSGIGALSPTRSANGTYTEIIKANNTALYFASVGASTTLDIDNVSVEELNWSNATEIYDAVYAATSGDAATKEYAALKEAAMWCYYNNSADNGAIYGKLYNWYAAKLLDLDMASAGFGWRVPTSAQFTTLADALGGTSVAGGKMKMTGTDYWDTPNTGADNSSGFTALGNGRRSSAGGFSNIKILGMFWGNDKSRMFSDNTTYNITIDMSGENWGYSIRLIKD